MADIEKFVYYENGSKKVLKPTDRIVVGSGGLAFEGSTSNDFETELAVTDPTDDRTITFPDEDGEVALLQGDSLAKALSFPVKNPSTTTTLTKGQIVYISGHSGTKPEVSLARSDSASTMPAFGFVQSDISPESEGYVVYSGLFKGLNTDSGFSEGDTLYVSSSTAGAFQNTAPSGSNLIQNIGKIVRSHNTNGEILVGGAGRTNATPNLNEGKFFIGNASNQSSISAYVLPTSDGSANQVLTTDGSGNVTFSTVDPTTYSSFTTNRVIHANASGVLTASDFLKVDDSNNRFGIGTLTPLTTVEIVGDTAGEAQLSVRQHNNDPDGPDVVFYKSRGTESSKTAVQASDALTRINTKAYNGTAYVDSGYYGWTASDSAGNSTFALATRVSGTQAERFSINSNGITTISGGLKMSDSVKITLGTGGDLEIFHDGTNSIIKDTASSGGSTIKYLAGTQTFQNKDENKTMAVLNASGSADLHYNGSKKFETTASGVQTTGTVNINGAYSFPTSDGSADQVLATDGSGSLSFVTASSGGGGYTYSAIDSNSTTAFTVQVGYHYSVDCYSAAVTANLPDYFVAGLSAGDYVRFKLTDNTNSLTVSPNGMDTIDGSSSDRVMSNSQESITLIWGGSSGNWEIV